MPKEIFVRRHDHPSTILPPDIDSTSMKRIGSVLQGTGPLRGLTFEEEAKYLPQIIGVAPNSPEFSKATTAYWANISIPVSIDGYKLNIGMRGEEPENVEDWIKWRFLLKHPEVETSKQEANASFKARYYIFDPDKETERLNKRARLELEATIELQKVLTSPTAEESIRRLTRVLVSQNPDRMNRAQMENALLDIARSDPDRFIATARDKHLELQDLTLQLVDANVVQKIGEQYRYNDETIAATMDEMVAFLANKSNSRVYGEMRAKLAEAQK